MSGELDEGKLEAMRIWQAMIARGDDPRDVTGWPGAQMLLNLPDHWFPDQQDDSADEP